MPGWNEIAARRDVVLARLRERASDVVDCLTSYETRATARDEVERAVRTLAHLEREGEALCRAEARAVASFLPVNQPLYALVLFGIVPG